MTRQRPKRAVALQYDPQKATAPRVTAKGAGSVAEKIISLAKANGIPVKDDPDLVEVLSGLELNEEIPAELYVVVAELLAFVYRMNGKNRTS